MKKYREKAPHFLNAKSISIAAAVVVGALASIHFYTVAQRPAWDRYEVLQEARDAKCREVSGYGYSLIEEAQSILDARETFKVAAKQGDVFSQYCLGNFYRMGWAVGRIQNFELMFTWYLAAADQGDILAQYELTKLYQFGYYGNEDYGEAYKWLLRAAEQGDARAQYDLSKFYYLGNHNEGGLVDDEAAFKWLEQAALQGHPEAADDLGKYYEDGTDGAVDIAAARKSYAVAARNGSESAKWSLKTLKTLKTLNASNEKWNDYKVFQMARDIECLTRAGYKSGAEFDPELQELQNTYQNLADGGDMLAQYCLGFFYLRRENDKANEGYEQAAKWFRMAAEQGDMLSQYNLAQLYDVGYLPKNPDEAFKWFLLAAEQGDGRAQLAVGYIYHGGAQPYKDLVKQDQFAARRWFGLAAAKGDPTAQYWLGYLYQNGLGGDVDLALARKYYNLAALQGIEGAQLNLDALRRE